MLWRRYRDRAITVRDDFRDGDQGVPATNSTRPMLKNIEARLPPVIASASAEPSTSAKTNRALTALAPVMLVPILVILMLQLQRMSLLTLVVLTAPLGLIGVVIALLMFKAPLGFVAILGVIALGGMIMRNSVILVDQVQKKIAEDRGP